MNAFNSLYHFFHMGGYAAYVWPAYILVVIVLILNIIIPLYQRRKLRSKSQ